MIKKCFFRFLCLIVLLACMVGSGCTTHQNTQDPAQGNPSPVATPFQPQNPATPPATLPPSMAPTTVPTVMISTTQTPVNDGLSATLNSAVKKVRLGSSTPMPGNIFLVLDITLQNNDKNNDFEYSDASFVYFDKLNKKRNTAITYKIPGGLNNPLTTGTIPLKSKITGQVAFGVLDSSNSYKFSVVDPTGTVLTSIDNINVP